MNFVLLVVLVVAAGAPLAAQQRATNFTPPVAQEDSVLREAVRLASGGRPDSARTLVRQRLDQVSTRDPVYAEALYTAGVVATGPDEALSYFRRIGIEFTQSDWADDALLRIAQLTYAAGDLRGAARAADRLLLDYPFSDLRSRAAYWGGRAKIELGDVEAGCGMLETVNAAIGEDVELANRTSYYLQRCASVLAGDTARAPSAQTRASRIAYSVQVAAVSNPQAADELMRALNREGYESRVVSEDGLLKIRVGRFPNRATAQNLAAELKRKFGGEPFVVEGS